LRQPLLDFDRSHRTHRILDVHGLCAPRQVFLDREQSPLHRRVADAVIQQRLQVPAHLFDCDFLGHDALVLFIRRRGRSLNQMAIEILEVVPVCRDSIWCRARGLAQCRRERFYSAVKLQSLRRR
jgi:hypothetical protein